MQEIPLLNKQTEPLSDKQQINPGEKSNQGNEPISTQAVEQVDKQENPKEKIDFSGDFIKIVEKIKQEGEGIELSDEEEEILRQEFLKMKDEKIKEAVSFLEDVKEVADHLVNEGINQIKAFPGINYASRESSQSRRLTFLIRTAAILNMALVGARLQNVELMNNELNVLLGIDILETRRWVEKVGNVGEIRGAEVASAISTIMFLSAIEEKKYWMAFPNIKYAFLLYRTERESRDNVFMAVKGLKDSAYKKKWKK